MSLLSKLISGSQTDAITDVPAGAPSLNIISDNLLVSYKPEQNNSWYGRTSMKELNNGIWVLIYANSEAHHILVYSQLHIRFSDDYGETWTDEDKHLDGTSISNFPMYPPGAVPGDNEIGPGEPWLYVAPNGDLILHMWKADYGVANYGSYQSISSDGGKVWSVPTLITFINNTGISISNNLNIFSTDDDFVYDGVIFAGAREYQDNMTGGLVRSWLIKSFDNGQTWHLISLLSQYSDKTDEYGMTYVGGNTIVVGMRGTPAIVGSAKSYYTKSTDWGQTWQPLSEIQGIYDYWSRQRLKTRSFLHGKVSWWDDPVVILNGFVHMDGANNLGHPRRLAVWISKDHGATFTGPLWLRAEGRDGGYGDFLYNPVKDEYVTTQYYAPTSLYDGEIRQINWKLIWS